MTGSFPTSMVGRRTEWARLQDFVRSRRDGPSLGLVRGRRRVGKTYLLRALAEETGGLWHQATRGASAEALRDLGKSIAAWQGAPAPLALGDWGTAIETLISLGTDHEAIVVLDEYPYLLEHTPSLDSVIQRALTSSPTGVGSGRLRLILCGSAMTVMGRMLSGSAPLRGRAALDMQLQPFDFRVARELHGIEDPRVAHRTFAVIGGVAAYAREMVDDDLPDGPRDFDRWICRRVLSPSSPLFNEVGLLLSEDSTMSSTRKINLYHAALAGVATGHHAHRKLTAYMRVSGPSLAPILDALVATGLVERVEDPLRERRPTYHPADPLIRFHYAVLRRHGARLAHADAPTRAIWREIRPTFEAQVVGSAFEQTARDWVRHFADADVAGGPPEHVGPTTVTLRDGSTCELDVVVASGAATSASERRVLAIGEAKSGETVGMGHLRRLEEARDALGARAEGAKLLLFGSRFTRGLAKAARARRDVEVVGWEELYGG